MAHRTRTIPFPSFVVFGWVFAFAAAGGGPWAAGAAAQVRDTVQLPDLEVATRRPTPAAKVTASVTVLDGEQLRREGVRFVLDALRQIPGAMVVQTGSFGGVTSLFLRGGESDYVKVLIDGVPANQAGGSFDFANLTLDNVERIEVIRGPASVLYGSDAVSGVISIVTRGTREGNAVRRDGEGGGTVAVEAGTFDTRTASGAVSGTAAGSGHRLGYSVAASRVVSDGIYDFNNRYRNTSASAAASLTTAGGTRIVTALRYVDAVHHFPTDFAGTPADSNQRSTEERVTVSADLGRAFTSTLDGRLQLLGNFASFDAANDPDSPGDSLGFGFFERRTTRASRRSADGRVTWTPGAVTLTLGGAVEAEHEEQFAQSLSNFGGGVFPDASTFERDRHTASGYAQVLADLPAGVELQGGLRVDDNDAFGTFVTARGGVGVRLTSFLRGRVSVGSAFKAPTFSEQFARSPFEVGNPDLDPERSLSGEIGVTLQGMGHRVVLDAAAFAQRFTDLIQFRFVDAATPSYLNVARARARGVETDLTVALPLSLALQGGYTYTSTRVTDAGVSRSEGFAEGRRLLRRPTHSAQMTVRWAAPAGRASLAGMVQWIGNRDDVDFRPFPSERVVLGDYALVNLAGSLEIWRRAGRAVRVELRAENLFDREYESVVGFPGRGRGIFAGSTVRW